MDHFHVACYNMSSGLQPKKCLRLATMKASVLVSAFVSFSTLMDTNSTKCKLLKTMKDVLDRS